MGDKLFLWATMYRGAIVRKIRSTKLEANSKSQIANLKQIQNEEKRPRRWGTLPLERGNGS